MAIKLYRRHRPECEGGHPEDSKSGEFEEGRRGWKKCACIIHATGTLGRKFNRRQTNKSDWDEAKAVVDAWERAGNWDGPKLEPSPSIDPVQPNRTTILDATDAFLARCKNRGVQPATFAKYQTFVNQLRTYCMSRGYVLVGQLTVSDMDRFYAS